MGKQEKKIRAHLYVSGRVQGVGFRSSAMARAQSLDINGWVKNLADGRIEAVFEGEENNVKEMIKWMKKGPLFAKVDGVEVSIEDSKNRHKVFQIIR